MKLRLFLLLSFFAVAGLAQTPDRPAKFAKPIEVQGLPNFHQVTPQIYRSAQPWREGFRELEKMGFAR